MTARSRPPRRSKPLRSVGVVLTLATLIVGAVSLTACGTKPEAARHVRIHDIQGPGHLSPLRGLSVVDVVGIVTASHDAGFWMQDPQPDDRADTSEGIYVHTTRRPKVRVGDQVKVSGAVEETRQDDGDLTVTQIVRPKVSKTGTGVLPAPIRIGRNGVAFPAHVYASATGSDASSTDVERSGHFDHGRNALDAAETMEGMRAEITNPIALGPAKTQLPVYPDGASAIPPAARNHRGGMLGLPSNGDVGNDNTGRVMLGGTLAALPRADTGTTFPGAISGIWHYASGNYTLLPSQTPSSRPSTLKPETAAGPQQRQLSIAGLTIDPKDTKADRLASIIVKSLGSPDIVVVSKATDLSAITTALNQAGGPRYEQREIAPSSDKDRKNNTGFLFRPDRARFIDRPGGGPTTATNISATAGRAQLSSSPGLIDPEDDAFSDSGKPLVGEFDIHGASLFVIGSDFASDGGDSPRYGRYQPPRTPGSDRRLQQAEKIHSFAKRLGEVSTTARVVTMAAVHDSDGSESSMALTKDNVLRPASETLDAKAKYSQLEDGAGTLTDQAFTSPNIRGVGYAIVHTSTEFDDNGGLYHDPQLLRIRSTLS